MADDETVTPPVDGPEPSAESSGQCCLHRERIVRRAVERHGLIGYYVPLCKGQDTRSSSEGCTGADGAPPDPAGVRTLHGHRLLEGVAL